ncbi:MAG: phosphoenolpyruvate--protein phosphotransferase [Chlamydiia bacterium]|nr:phosphoenolpyruvate--protein phosphotransferase [Chlamydiia bacterium]
MHLSKGLRSRSMEDDLEFRIQGAPVSEGIAIGTSFFIDLAIDEVIPEFAIKASQVAYEITRYRDALSSCKIELTYLKQSLQKEGSLEAIDIIDTHILMLEDPLIKENVEEKIRVVKRNTESVFSTVIRDYEKKFSKMKDPFFQQRIVDILDLSKRILSHLSDKGKLNFSEIPLSSVVFSKELIPSHTAAIQASRVCAFVTQSGGGNSHAALIARAKGIPYVSSIDVDLFRALQGKSIIIDGQTGEVIVNPKPSTLARYKEIKTRLKTSHQLLQQDINHITETVDGYSVHILANAGNLHDLEEMHIYRAEGVGLFRSEYLFLEKHTLFISEEEQVCAYIDIIKKAKGLPCVIRVFDIGGDKNPNLFFEHEKEANPVLGCRGIRFLLRYPNIFRTQLRAIMRASYDADVRILLPLISDIHELLEAKRIIGEVHNELVDQGLIQRRTYLVGCMIEVPSVVFICDAIAKESDFLSIGTNDLVQYTLGIDRSNPSMSDFCYPAHPSVIRMIKMVVMEARKQNKPVTICGEIASNPVFVPLLLGLGVNNFSCSPRYIPFVKRAVRNTVLLEAYELAQRILQMSSPIEISQTLLEAYSNSMPASKNSGLSFASESVAEEVVQPI